MHVHVLHYNIDTSLVIQHANIADPVQELHNRSWICAGQFVFYVLYSGQLRSTIVQYIVQKEYKEVHALSIAWEQHSYSKHKRQMLQNSCNECADTSNKQCSLP